MRVLIIGGTGYLGSELIRQAVAEHHAVAATSLTRAAGGGKADWLRLDIRDRAAVGQVIATFRPDAIINAAYRQSDWATTADGAAHVALAAEATGSHLVHVSSDVVFSGNAITYTEDRAPDPISPYGAAKTAAEVAVRAICPAAAIARTSLIIGDGGSPQETFVHALASGRVDGALFTDDVRCPVHVSDLAAALLELATITRPGIHHIAGPDAISRYELGRLIATRDHLDPTRLPTALRANTDLLGPIDVRLDCTQTRRHLRTRLRGAHEFLSP